MAIPTPEFEHAEEIKYDTLATNPRVGPYFRGAIHEKQRRRFRLEWKRASLTDKNDLLAEIDSAKGGAGTLSYTPVDEASPITVRFVDDSLRWDWVTGGAIRMSVILEEEIS